MKVFGRMFLISAIVISTSACTIRHLVEQDYPQYLVNNAGGVSLPKTDKTSEYFLTPATQQHKYEFRAAMTGAAHLWIVEFGKMLDDTLMSSDIQIAFGTLRKVSDAAAVSNSLLIFDLQNYTFSDFSAHVSLKISLSRSGQVVFSKTYTQDGKSQGGKMFWGGTFAQKNAVHQSTKDAVDKIVGQLISDLNTI
jgi:hypothetical protein